MQLHLFNQAPSHPSWQDALKAIASKDRVVFMQDAVYACSHAYYQQLSSLGVTCYVMLDDAALRGIAIKDALQTINSQQLVELSLQAQHCISWY